MSHPDDLLSNLERQRLQLEQQISELQRSVYNWRLWDAEYDGLREELDALGDSSTKDDILRTTNEFGGSLVTEDEIRNLLGEPQGITRSRKQVMEILGRRVDYVRDNIKTLEKRIRVAEDKLLKVLVVEQPGGDVNEEGLPMTDIVEQLDEEGRVISGSTTTPGRSAEEILEVLKKAGVKDIAEGDREEPPSAETKERPDSLAVDNVLSKADVDELSTSKPADGYTSADSGSNTAKLGSNPSVQFFPGTRDKKEDIQTTDIDESPEDAALRREILQYGLEEVGAVVAELEIDESASEFSISDEEYDDYLVSDEDEEEDEYGRATRRVISDDYHKQMRELEKKLGAKSLHNIGPDVSGLPPEIRQGLEEQESKHGKGETEQGKPTKKKQKKVAFADELDIAPETPIAATAPNPVKVKAHEPPAIRDVIMEHTSTTKDTAVAESKPKKKISRFRSARTGEESAASEPIFASMSANPPTLDGPIGYAGIAASQSPSH
ncbi:predicted protein [Uncinocarpus reesii 1704]|uniref:DUF3835 domain-containing protein n=1 Tax=Uncinocarpus reesii (strain UAMH 1704) TaxID=336963 RepID=C4JGA6_UNCRE|nr:uncharacterized protein UREG_02504 [Uncinocarpus reesii 1704]EEP77655.1 predicted protein [Uncinocarpus reesii 1704]